MKNCKPLWISILSTVRVSFIVIWLVGGLFSRFENDNRCRRRVRMGNKCLEMVLRVLASTGHWWLLMCRWAGHKGSRTSFQQKCFLCFAFKRRGAIKLSIRVALGTLKYQWSTHTLSIASLEDRMRYKIEFISRTNDSLIEHFHIPLWVVFRSARLAVGSSSGCCVSSAQNRPSLAFYGIDILIRCEKLLPFSPALRNGSRAFLCRINSLALGNHFSGLAF